MDLQTSFYIIGIIFMIIMFILIVGILTTVLVIKNKINHMQNVILQKVDKMRNITDKGATFLRFARHFVKM